MSFSLSLNTPPDKKDAAARPARVEAPRPQYIELKANVHRKLLNRLNLEALASVERSRAEADIRALLFDLIAEESMPLSMSERDAILGDVIDEVFGLGPLEPLLRDTSISDILVNTYKHVYVERSGKLDRLPTTLPGRQAPDARHRPHRERRRPARRRQLADGRRAPARWLACERDHPAARGRRPAALDSPLSRRAPAGRGSRRHPIADAPDARVPGSLRPRAPERAHQRRHGRRQDDAAQRAVGLHLRARAHRHDRGRGRAAAAPGARRAARDAAAERRRQGRDPRSASCSSTPCVCAPTASSSARSEAKRRSTCCRR